MQLVLYQNQVTMVAHLLTLDIALEFASWLSPEFKLYLIKEFERLKKNEVVSRKN